MDEENKVEGEGVTNEAAPQEAPVEGTYEIPEGSAPETAPEVEPEDPSEG